MSSEANFKVPTTTLGKSGLRISKIILGCMTYGSKKWNGSAEWVLEGDEALEHFKAAYDLGIFTWDTANAYSNGVSERLVGQAIKKYNIPREKVVILTKLFFPANEEDLGKPVFPPKTDEYTGLENQWGLNRKNIFAAVKASLERLGTDYIDVLQCHRFDYNTPIEETMQALNDVVKAGYVRYIGMSSCWAYQFHAMQNYAINNGLTPFISMQDLYNAAYREEEREMFPTLDLFGVASIPWSPLGLGFLARPISEQENSTRGKTDMFFRTFFEQNRESSFAINAAVETIAKKRGVSMAQIALAFVLANKTVAAPIVGSTKIKSIEELAHATKIQLTDDELEAIKKPYIPRGPFFFE